MRNLFLKRIATSDLGTFGVFCLGSIPVCLSCELPWKDNQNEISCIPVGSYLCEPWDSEQHPISYRLIEVPNRKDVLIHPGNSIANSRGCILPGTSFDPIGGVPGVWHSMTAMKELRDLLGKNEFGLLISEHYEAKITVNKTGI